MCYKIRAIYMCHMSGNNTWLWPVLGYIYIYMKKFNRYLKNISLRTIFKYVL